MNMHSPYLLIIAVLVGYIIFLQQCRSPETPEPEVEQETVVHRDTVTVERTDTVWVEAPEQIISLEVPATPDTVYADSASGDSLREYTRPFSNEYASGSLWAAVEGHLRDWELEFIPKVRQITRERQIRYNQVVSVPQYYTRPSNTSLSLGVELSGNPNQQSVSALAGIRRNSYEYRYRYDPLLKHHGFSIARYFSF